MINHTYTRSVIVTNKAQYKLCGDIIESKSSHDFKRCKCGEIAVDGGKNYILRAANNPANIIELSETYEEEVKIGDAANAIIKGTI